MNRIVAHLDRGEIVIASVSHGFEVGKKYILDDGSKYIVPRGGHLVLVYGASVKDKDVDGLFLHHPSSYPSYEWPNHCISAKQFLSNFSHRGNIVFLGQ